MRAGPTRRSPRCQDQSQTDIRPPSLNGRLDALVSQEKRQAFIAGTRFISVPKGKHYVGT